MPTEIIDLSNNLGTPKKVRLEKDGPVYSLPYEIPVPFYLKMKARSDELSRLSEEDDNSVNDVDTIEELHNSALELFQIHNPNLEVLPIGVGRVFSIINEIYNVNSDNSDGETNEDVNPTKTRARTGSVNSTKRKSPTKR